jgi:hypothetical protein
MQLKPGYQVVFGGNARTLNEASSDLAVAVILAVAFIYVVLASQFDSFIQPLSIMAALPLSLPAGLLALMTFGMTLNVYSTNDSDRVRPWRRRWFSRLDGRDDPWWLGALSASDSSGDACCVLVFRRCSSVERFVYL